MLTESDIPAKWKVIKPTDFSTAEKVAGLL